MAKLAFMPHERRVSGAWQRFCRGDHPRSGAGTFHGFGG